MNIGIFSDTYFPQLNGVATSIRTLTHALREKGHTVYIFTPSDPRCEGQLERYSHPRAALAVKGSPRMRISFVCPVSPFISYGIIAQAIFSRRIF